MCKSCSSNISLLVSGWECLSGYGVRLIAFVCTFALRLDLNGFTYFGKLGWYRIDHDRLKLANLIAIPCNLSD